MTDAFVKGYRTVENLEFCAECYADADFVPFSTPEGLSGWNPAALAPSDFVASVMAEYGVDEDAVYRWSEANASGGDLYNDVAVDGYELQRG